MIKGIGTDITDMRRMGRIVGDGVEAGVGERFLKRIMTDNELVLLAKRPRRRTEFAAGRFAAKEAVSKALGCGIGGALGFMDMEIMPDRLGKPECRVSLRSRQALGLAEDDRIHITISHSDGYAVAFAVWESQA